MSVLQDRRAAFTLAFLVALTLANHTVGQELLVMPNPTESRTVYYTLAIQFTSESPPAQAASYANTIIYEEPEQTTYTLPTM